jgi:ribose transport system substrate-binding protein
MQRIALFTKNQTNPFYQSVRLGAQNAADRLNVELVNYIPAMEDSIPEQMSQIEDITIKRPDAVVFVPVDFKAMVPAVQKLNAANIPVVNIVDKSAGGDVVTFVGADDYNLGLQVARHLFTKMNGEGNIVILEGIRGALTSSERVRGFHKALEEYPKIKALASQPGNYQRLQALQVTENLLQSNPKIDGVLAANDAMAIGAIEALGGANRKALVVGMNGTQEAIDAIKAGLLVASGEFSGYLQGCLGVMAAVRHLQRQPVPKEIILPVNIFDASNYETEYVPDAQRTCPEWEVAVKE